MNSFSGIDVYGLWFDGVVIFEKSDDYDVDVEVVKVKEVVIVGVGMFGLIMYFIFSEVGFNNLIILEGSYCFGGCVCIEYFLGGFKDYFYVEMGFM